MSEDNSKRTLLIIILIIFLLICLVAYSFYKLVTPFVLDISNSDELSKTPVVEPSDTIIEEYPDPAKDKSVVLSLGNIQVENGIQVYTNSYLNIKITAPEGYVITRPQNDEMEVLMIDENRVGHILLILKAEEGPALLNMDDYKIEQKRDYGMEFIEGSDNINDIHFYTLAYSNNLYNRKTYYKDIDSGRYTLIIEPGLSNMSTDDLSKIISKASTSPDTPWLFASNYVK